MSFIKDGAFGAKAARLGQVLVGTSLTSVAADTLGFSHAVIVASFGVLTDTATMVINVASSATSGGSYVDVPGFTYTIDAAADDNTDVIIGVVSLSGVERFLRAEAVIAGTGNVTGILTAYLTGAKYTPEMAPRVEVGPTPAA